MNTLTQDERAQLIAEHLNSPRGRRFLAWSMVQPIRGPMPQPDPLPWEGYPDSPIGTLEVWEEIILTKPK